MKVLVPKEIECAEEDQFSYEIQWIIPNWELVRQNVILVRNQMVTFETGLQPPQMIQTKWLVGLEDYPNCSGGQGSRVYWQLLEIKASGSQLTLDAKLKTTLCEVEPLFGSKIDVQNQEVSLGGIIKENVAYLDIGNDLGDLDNSFINSSGAIEYKLVLTFKTATVDNNSSHNHSKRLKVEQFSKRSHAQLRENLATLLNEDSNGDLKIVTSDGVELRAYQCILKVQCPVFSVMLNSDLSEIKTGVVKVDDISSKTMKILLHYFYTGDLLNGWSDRETILEFTYAAGKYQITQILELLDDWFGRNVLSEVSNLDVQLLNLVGKLSLKNAERRLLQQIIGKVGTAKSSEDLFQLFGCDKKEEISKNADALAGEPFGSTKLLEILDYAVGNNEQQVDFSDHGFVLLALVQRNGSFKGLEKILLKQVAEITSKFTSAEEIIKFFGGGG